MNQPYISTKSVIIREDGKILALRRSATCPRRPLTWDLPGGDVEFGEDLVESVKREIQEEAGITVSKVELLDAVGFVAKNGEYWVTIGYLSRVPQDTSVMVSSEHNQFDWLTRDEFLVRESTERIKRFLSKIS